MAVRSATSKFSRCVLPRRLMSISSPITSKDSLKVKPNALLRAADSAKPVVNLLKLDLPNIAALLLNLVKYPAACSALMPNAVKLVMVSTRPLWPNPTVVSSRNPLLKSIKLFNSAPLIAADATAAPLANPVSMLPVPTNILVMSASSLSLSNVLKSLLFLI